MGLAVTSERGDGFGPEGRDMPRRVRVAQVVTIIGAVLGVIYLIARVISLGFGGMLQPIGGYGLWWVTAVVVLNFRKGVKWTRVAAMRLAAFSIPVNFVDMALGVRPGLAGVVAAIVVLIALAPRSAKYWFDPDVAEPDTTFRREEWL